jgi:hypothetical protein
MPSFVLAQLILKAKDDMSISAAAYRRRLADLISEKIWGDCDEPVPVKELNALWAKLRALHRDMMFDVT